MNAVVSVTIKTADGVERTLRSTRGAKALIRERFKSADIVNLLNEHGEEAMFEIAWFMMHDEQGNPPAGLPLKQFMFTTPASTESLAEIMAAITSAMSQGQQSKNELEAPMLEGLKAMEEARKERLMTTLLSGASAISASESEAEPNTTGDSSNASSSPSLIDTESKSEPETSVPEPSRQPFETLSA